MKTKPLIQICDLCGGSAARLRRVPRTYGKGASLLVVENVPVISCPDCGESYLEPETIRAIEKIRNRARSSKRSVPLVSLGKV